MLREENDAMLGDPLMGKRCIKPMPSKRLVFNMCFLLEPNERSLLRMVFHNMLQKNDLDLSMCLFSVLKTTLLNCPEAVALDYRKKTTGLAFYE